MPKLNFHGRDYDLDALKKLASQGVALHIPTTELVSESPEVNHPILVVTQSGTKYAILLGRIDPKKPEQSVRMLSKVVLKKALYEAVNPPPEAVRHYTDNTPQDQRGYRPNRDFNSGYRGNRY